MQASYMLCIGENALSNVCKPLTHFEVFKMESPNLYKPPTCFEVVKTLRKECRRLAVVVSSVLTTVGLVGGLQRFGECILTTSKHVGALQWSNCTLQSSASLLHTLWWSKALSKVCRKFTELCRVCLAHSPKLCKFATRFVVEKIYCMNLSKASKRLAEFWRVRFDYCKPCKRLSQVRRVRFDHRKAQ